MEFGFEPVCDQVRAGSSYLDMPNSITLSWSQTGPKLVADRSEAGRRPLSDLLLRASSLLAS